MWLIAVSCVEAMLKNCFSIGAKHIEMDRALTKDRTTFPFTRTICMVFKKKKDKKL